MMQSPADFTAPPTVRIAGSVPVKNAKWVIESIDWGTAYVIWRGGVRLRQDAVVHLLQFVDDTVVTVKRQPTANQPYVLKAGDTLRGLAAQRGVDLQKVLKLNGLRDPKNVRPGLTILFPPSIFPPSGDVGQAPKVTPKKNPFTNSPKSGFTVPKIPGGFGYDKPPAF
jgi:LysM repeat protein